MTRSLRTRARRGRLCVGSRAGSRSRLIGRGRRVGHFGSPRLLSHGVRDKARDLLGSNLPPGERAANQVEWSAG